MCINFKMAKNISIVLVSQGSVNKLLQAKWLKTTELDRLTVLAAVRLKSRFWQGHDRSEGSRGEPLPLPGFGVCWQCLACRCIPQFSAFDSILCSPYVFLHSVCLCLNFLLLIRAPVIGFQPTLIKHDLILNNYT